MPVRHPESRAFIFHGCTTALDGFYKGLDTRFVWLSAKAFAVGFWGLGFGVYGLGTAMCLEAAHLRTANKLCRYDVEEGLTGSSCFFAGRRRRRGHADGVPSSSDHPRKDSGIWTLGLEFRASGIGFDKNESSSSGSRAARFINT